ncbi:DNA polymerase III subunit beta [Nonomuraea polychroma]|uniref:DNA polymerase III subunit beta n=1 Tax=Nonomuraea polychroma TaxID=46176 RepID=UPI003D89E885
MKFTIDPKLLADTVASAARALPQRPVVPVLSGLLVHAASNQVTVSAFDYGTSYRGTVAAEVAEPGEVLVPGRLLAEVAKSLPTTMFVDVTSTDREVVLTCGPSEFGLITMPVEDYPSLPEPPMSAGTADGAVLARAVEQVAIACAKDDTLPMLTGVRVDADGRTLTLAATDRYRIAVRDLPWQPHTATSLGQLVPGKILHDIVRDLHGPVTIAVNEQLAAFTTDTRETTVRLLDNQFIDYRARVDIDTPIVATVDAAALAGAVKRVALVAEKNTAIRLTFTAGEVLVQAGGGDIGRGRDAVPCELDGDTIEIAFQSQFLLDALNAIDGPARIGMEGGTKPARISCEDGSYRCLVMSLRLS